MSEWVTEGVSARSPWGITNPTIHLLVTSADNRMWCSGDNGRPEVHHANSTPTGRRRLCHTCRALARESVGDETLSPDALSRDWVGPVSCHKRKD